MVCPFCLTKIKSDVNPCSSCQKQLPPDYVRHHSGWTAKRPAIVSVIGFRGHGKTVYLGSLYFALQNLVPRAWLTFFRQGLTMNTLKVLHQNLNLLKRGEMPETTQMVFPEPNIDRLQNIPKFGDRTLLMFDPSGEAFEIGEDNSFQRYAGFVKQSPCALFLVSLTDMMNQFESEYSVAGEMERLLETYNVGMSNMGASTEEQHLIVVYTKADRLLSHSSLPADVIKCLENSAVNGLSDLKEYQLEMKKNSSLLRNFTVDTLNARGFLSNAETNFKSVEFCAVSALGSEPSGDRLVERISPRRVIDPLLWVLYKS